VVPTAPTGSAVVLRGDLAALSWASVSGATGYDIRIADTTMGLWTPGQNGDVVIDDFKGTSLILRLTPGHQYHWWLDARNDVGGSGAQAGPDFQVSP
jgi:hypothetical protein